MGQHPGMTDPHPYAARLDRVLRHIALNLAGDLSLDRLAEVAALSRFHFHRIFAAMTGETAAEAVRRARLNRAAVLLVTTTLPLPRVAAAVGYPDPDSFTRALRSAFGTTPAALRRGGRLPPILIPKTRGELPMHPVTIAVLPDRRLAALPHHGAYPAIGATLSALWQRAQATGLVARSTGPTVAIYYDDPSAVPVADLRAHAGLEIADAADLPEGIDPVILPGGRHAVLRLTGPYSGLPAAWAWLYGVWLPGSGEEPAERAPFEVYLNGPDHTPAEELVTEVCVPLR
jgi:AraC family transcriptional regulator